MASRETWQIVRWGLIAVVAVLPAYPIWRYYTNQVPPTISISGADAATAFKGEATIEINTNSVCSLSSCKVLFDGKPIEMTKGKLAGRKHGRAFYSFDTTKLADGIHTIDVEAVDGGHHGVVTRQQWPFSIDNADLRVTFVDKPITVKQGHTAHIKFETNKRIGIAKATMLGNSYYCGSNAIQATCYDGFIPVDCEVEPGTYPVEIHITDLVGRTQQLNTQITVVANQFPRQRGYAISELRIDADHNTATEDSVLEDLITNFYKTASAEKLWRGNFEAPTVVNSISTPFGEIRTTPVKGRYLHRAVDIISLPKKVVWASQVGRVIARDTFTIHGNTVVLDHGMGVITIYSHLDSFADIKLGDVLPKGKPLGTIGKTGYASGYHLHWELRVNNIAVNPLEWLEKTF